MDQICNRIANLRIECKLTQHDLAIRLSEISKRKSSLSVATISSWETGRRHPSSDMLKALASLFGVSILYIQGLSDNRNGEPSDDDTSVSASVHSSPEVSVISRRELPLFDGKPVFVTFKDNKYLDQWGIYHGGKHAFIMRDFILKDNAASINEIFTFSPYAGYFPTKPLSMPKLHSCSQVYVIMATSDPNVQSMYNGWFSHNETHTCLINNVGLTLPYEGLNISYYAYNF